MVKFGQIVLGPAGSGKSTYCGEIQKHCNDKKRAVHVINMDPVSCSTPSFRRPPREDEL